MSEHSKYHYSTKIKTDDEAVLQCLRALSLYAQSTGNNRIPWGGTKKGNWERDKHHVTFHFSTPKYREKFLEEVFRLIPKNLWDKKGENDNDPAMPQS